MNLEATVLIQRYKQAKQIAPSIDLFNIYVLKNKRENKKQYSYVTHCKYGYLKLFKDMNNLYNVIESKKIKKNE